MGYIIFSASRADEYQLWNQEVKTNLAHHLTFPHPSTCRKVEQIPDSYCMTRFRMTCLNGTFQVEGAYTDTTGDICLVSYRLLTIVTFRSVSLGGCFSFSML